MGVMMRNGLKRESGQSLAEYGLCLALVAVVCITALSSLGSNLSEKLNCIATAVAPQGGGGASFGGSFGGGGGNAC